MSILVGKVALITGAARGQGAAHADAFARAGASVVLTDIRDNEGAAIARDLGKRAIYLHLDVSLEEDWVSVIGKTEAVFGRLDILVNNAGVWKPLTIAETTVDAYRILVQSNQLGTFLGMRSAVAPMRRAGGGSIVNVSSIAGLKGLKGNFPYTTTKWAVRGMTKVAATELAPFNIRVNVIYPGAIDTRMIEGYSMVEAMAATPLNRLGQAKEVSELVLFLASDRSSYITGSDIAIDGGWSA